MAQTVESTLEKPSQNGAGQQGTEQQAPAAPPKRGFPKGILLLVLALVAGAAAWFFLSGLGVETTDDAFIEGHVIQVSPHVPGHIQQVHVDDNQVVKAGEVLFELDPADYQVKVEQAKAALGAAEARMEAARMGLAVTSGTTSADVTQASSGVDEARSALATARAQLASAQSMKRQAEAQLTAAQAEASEQRAAAKASEAQAVQAKSDLDRYQQLIKDGAISQQALDQAATAERSARANADSAREKAASAEAQVGAARAAVAAAEEGIAQAQTMITQAQARIEAASGRLSAANTAPHQVAASASQVKALEADLAQARAGLKQAELNLDYTRIKAPEDGRVTRKSAEPGNYVQAGQACLALVPSKVWVVANFKETQLAKMRPGQPARLEVDAYPGLELTGKVDSIQSGTGARFSLLPPENATGNYVKVVQRVPVKIVLDALPGGGQLLAPGMSVEPKVYVSGKPAETRTAENGKKAEKVEKRVAEK